MFSTDRPLLRRFYESGGFKVLGPVTPDLYASAGNHSDAMVPEPSESYFYVRP